MDVEPKRIIGLIHHLKMGGAERMMVTILNSLSKQGFDIHLVVFNYSGELKERLSSEVTVHDLGISSVMKGMPKCLKTLSSLKPDIVFAGIGHLNIAMAPFISVMKRISPKARWIARETNIVTLQNQTSKYPKLFDWLYRRTYGNYDFIIAQSEDMKNDLEENYGIVKNIKVINNPIDVERVTELSNVQHEVHFDAKKINLLTVARLREEKRHDLMLEAHALLPKEYHLTIVGAGDKEKVLKVQAETLGISNRVSFAGHQSNPYTYMKNADLFLLTSEREGFPNVLLEANALGLPIVAFACLGGIKEIITEGKNGYFVPFGETELLAKKIEELRDVFFDKELIILETTTKYAKESILEKYKKVFEL
jgi:glycosyltransferase involved in cell wall biosynthesis